jgi:hypothetical protein
MKQKLTLITLLAGFCTYISAQRFIGGPLFGINACQVDGDTYSGYNKFGVMAGAFVYTQISPRLDAQLEIEYMGKGAHKGPTDQDPTYYDNTLNYIELPVLLRFNTKNKIGCEAGLGFGYLFAYSQSDENGPLPSEEASPFNRFELSGIIGITYQFANQFKFGLRYSYSLTPIFNFNHYDTYYYRRYFTAGAYNNLFTMGVFYTIK